MFQATVLTFGDLLAGWQLATKAKFQHNISIVMPARQKYTGTINMGCECHFKGLFPCMHIRYVSVCMKKWLLIFFKCFHMCVIL